MPTAPTAHTPLPAAPSTDDPANFDTEADAFVGALETFGDQMDALGTNVYNNAVEAASSAAAALESQGIANTKAGQASDSAAAAAGSATAAAGSASTAAGWSATSTTSMALTSGSKTLTIQTAKQFTAGTNIKIKRTAAPTTTYAHTTVDSYNSGTGALAFTLSSDLIVGSGTYTDWTIELSGARGATGAGDVNGPASATANAVALYDGTTGKVLKDGPTYGTSGANKLLQLDADGKLPAVDGSQLTGIASGLTLLATVTASNSATVDFDGYFTSSYDEYLLIGEGIVPSSVSNPSLGALLKISGSYQTSNYVWAYIYQDSNSTTQNSATATADLRLANSASSSANFPLAVEMRFFQPASSVFQRVWARTIQTGGSAATRYEGFGLYSPPGGVNPTTAVQLAFSSGNVSTGTFRLYGFKK